MYVAVLCNKEQSNLAIGDITAKVTAPNLPFVLGTGVLGTGAHV